MAVIAKWLYQPNTSLLMQTCEAGKREQTWLCNSLASYHSTRPINTQTKTCLIIGHTVSVLNVVAIHPHRASFLYLSGFCQRCIKNTNMRYWDGSLRALRRNHLYLLSRNQFTSPHPEHLRGWSWGRKKKKERKTNKRVQQCSAQHADQSLQHHSCSPESDRAANTQTLLCTECICCAQIQNL